MNIEKIVSEINAGHLVVTPTDTVYGILADAMNPVAVEKVYSAKRRSKEKPLLMLTSDKAMLKEYADELNAIEESLIDKYMPGKLTVLLRKGPRVIDEITGNGWVGMRIPANKELREIISRVGHPLVSTSANLSDHAVTTNPELLEPELLEHIAYVENAGIVEGEPSSLVKVVGDEIVVLRGGEVAREIVGDGRVAQGGDPAATKLEKV